MSQARSQCSACVCRCRAAGESALCLLRAPGRAAILLLRLGIQALAQALPNGAALCRRAVCQASATSSWQVSKWPPPAVREAARAQAEIRRPPGLRPRAARWSRAGRRSAGPTSEARRRLRLRGARPPRPSRRRPPRDLGAAKRAPGPARLALFPGTARRPSSKWTRVPPTRFQLIYIYLSFPKIRMQYGYKVIRPGPLLGVGGGVTGVRNGTSCSLLQCTTSKASVTA